MRIAVRTGAGRGAYELAGHQGSLSASNLFDREISYELTPGIVVPGRAIAALRQGKARIALDDATRSKTTHLYRLLSAVLLLPKPKREFKTTHGEELLRRESYSMTAIKVDVAGLTDDSVILRPTDLLLENADDRREELDFTKRMARIVRLWNAAAQQDSELAGLVREMADAVKAGDPDYKVIERYAQDISDLLHTDGDALTLAEQQLEPVEPAQGLPASATAPQIAHEQFGLEDDVSPQEARVQRVKQWRQQAERGSAGRRFGRRVSSAYDYRCLFSGQRLPRLDVTDSPGVDSAHILPWSSYDLNSVRNGVCLNKECHWAFDQGILRLAFDDTSNAYVLSVPDSVRGAAARAGFDIEYFQSMAGAIPRARLPGNTALWPAPAYLDELNRYMDVI